MKAQSRRKIRFKLAGAISAAVAVCFFGFQNCSKIPLEKVERASVTQSMPGLSLKSHVCPQARFSAGQPTKFVFIMDLSASNFGGWRKKQFQGFQASVWDPSLATDPTDSRFDAVQYFIDNCGNQAGSQFAFIGFSNAAGVLAGGQFSCDGVAFGTGAQASSQMNALKARREQDEVWYKQWVGDNYLTQNTPDSIIYGATSYTSASRCLEKLITEDLTSPTNQSDNYRVFFISDGVPQDKPGTGCNLTTLNDAQKAQCYIESNLNAITMSRTAAMSKGKDLRIQGIYYGNDTVLPVVLNELSREGGTCIDPFDSTKCALKLSNFSTSKNALCDLVVSQSGIGYQPDIYMAVNLTMRFERGVLVADSDMDGIADMNESKLGYDPQNPRSSGVAGVLDGVCERFGGVNQCQTRRAQVTCSPNVFDKMGLSDCDIKMLGLDAIEGVIDPGVDSDRDGLTDFIEVLKGLDPTRSDTAHDPDGDHISNRDEILRGSDPFHSDSFIDRILLNKNRVSFRSAQASNVCAGGDWTLSVERLQTTRTLAVSDFPASASDLKHGRDEQVVAFIYRLTPTNSLEPEIEYYARYVNIAVTGKVGAEILTATPSTLKPEDFTLIGRVKP